MYTKEIRLNHNEVAAKINVETGEIKEVKNKVNNIPETSERFIADERFAKSYEKSWNYLFDVLSPIEIKIALKMSMMADMNTNSLFPLNDDTSIRELSDIFDVSTGMVSKSLKKLFKHGVYATFKYFHYVLGETETWIFNPYISFKGKLIKSDIKELFDDTTIAKLFKN